MRGARPPLGEIGFIGLVVAAVGAAVVATYARVPLPELYNVGDTGLVGGLGRALVYLNFPVAIVAIAVLPAIVDRLGATRLAVTAALAAAALCAVTVVPGVVEQDDLDAKLVNAVPALGVALVAALAATAARRGGLGLAPLDGWDGVRLALAAALAAVSIPWLFAEGGVYVSDLPLVGRVFLGDELRPEPGQPTLRAVHLGRHHGLDGALLALTGLLLSRVVPWLSRPRLRHLLALLVSALVVYGLLNAAQDAWLEQVVKRGWTDSRMPSFLRPSLSLAWAGLVVAVAAAYALVGRRLASARP